MPTVGTQDDLVWLSATKPQGGTTLEEADADDLTLSSTFIHDETIVFMNRTLLFTITAFEEYEQFNRTDTPAVRVVCVCGCVLSASILTLCGCTATMLCVFQVLLGVLISVAVLCAVGVGSLVLYVQYRVKGAQDEAAAVAASTMHEAVRYCCRGYGCHRTTHRGCGCVDQIMGYVCHEVRNPLHMILAIVELLRSEHADDLPPGVLYDVRTIEKAAKHMELLVRDIADMQTLNSSAMRVEPVSVDVAGLLRDVSNQWKHAIPPRVDFKVKLSHSTPGRCMLDQLHVRQVIGNALTNAGKATKQGSITLHVEARDEQLVFSISNTGVGLPVADASVLFQAVRGNTGEVRLHWWAHTRWSMAGVTNLLTTMLRCRNAFEGWVSPSASDLQWPWVAIAGCSIAGSLGEVSSPCSSWPCR